MHRSSWVRAVVMAGEEETKIQGKASGGSSWGISGGWSAGMAGSGWWDETTGRIVARLRGITH